MRANWSLLGYLGALATGVLVAFLLASLSVVLFLYGWVTHQPVADVSEWFTWAAVVALGILPWPGIVAIGRATLTPRKAERFRVNSRPPGSVIVSLTALDDEQAIEDVVDDFIKNPDITGVIVVDNGSGDRTRELATAAGAQVIGEAKKGYGRACTRALREGLASGHPVIVLCEADRTFRASDVEKLVAYLRHADLVIGSRTHSALLNSDSQLNSFFTLGNLFVAKLLQARYWDWITGGRVRLTDVGCTYLAIRSEALVKIIDDLEVGGSHFIPHLLIVALERGLRVVQVPVTFWKRVGVSKGGNASWTSGMSLGLAMIWHILTHRVRLARQPEPVPADALRQAPSR